MWFLSFTRHIYVAYLYVVLLFASLIASRSQAHDLLLIKESERLLFARHIYVYSIFLILSSEKNKYFHTKKNRLTLFKK